MPYIPSTQAMDRFYGTFYKISVDEFFMKFHVPVPIMPEILERCGFGKSDEDLFVFELNGIYVEYLLDDSKYYLSANQGEYWIGDGFTYVHQLQNLYFALTGEELVININNSIPA